LFCKASCISLSQLEPGNTTIPNFILFLIFNAGKITGAKVKRQF
jgi:hypothetical protein